MIRDLQDFSDEQLSEELERRNKAYISLALSQRMEEHRRVQMRIEECLAIAREHELLSSMRPCSDEDPHEVPHCVRCALLALGEDSLSLDYTIRLHVEYDPLPQEE